jgi:hypothetical protein
MSAYLPESLLDDLGSAVGQRIKAVRDLIAGNPWVSRTLTCPSLKVAYAEIELIAAAVTPLSRIAVDFAPTLDAENDIESLIDDDMKVYAIPETGKIRFILSGIGAFVGDFDICYKVEV